MTLLEIRALSKSFAGVPALRHVNLDVAAGEVHALVGENGAGKSTLIKLIGGVYERDSGTILFNDQVISYASPQEAKAAGIHTLHQEFNLLPGATVAENVFLGSEPKLPYLPFIDWRKMRQQTQDILDLLGLEISPDTLVRDLSVSEQQMVELAKTLHAQPRLLLMDEPTAPLSEREVKTLYQLIRTVKERNIGVIYISHRIEEVLHVADRVTVLRDGQCIRTVTTAEVSADELIGTMLGKTVNRHYVRPATRPGREILRVEGLSRSPAFEDVSFSLYSGEIVGLAGLVGSGRTALVRSIFGIDLPDSGQIFVDDHPVTIRSPQDAVALGMGLLPENRQEQALMLDLSARENITLARLGQNGELINRSGEHLLVEQFVTQLRIKMPSSETKPRFLSGGTQQKIVLSRWLAVRPRMLIFDEPTRGIDIGAKIEIYRLLGELASQGSAILMISSEIAEIAGLCDRALVMRAGRLIASLERDQITEQSLLDYAMGDDL
ncbi:MAG TPA: sugar ABC transporter ATP-binding protein [Aggregatilineales bacterium]|nr:sugar ABC transporter ATP-binding protein [Aggregatilineales bacterium]